MTLWKTVALSSLLAGAAGLGAAYAPVVYGQSRAPRAPASGIGEVLSIGHGSRLGVSIRDVDAEDVAGKSPSAGVVVDGVDEDSPAEKAGLKKGDILVEFDGERVRSVRQLTRLVSETPAGRNVTAAVMRGGSRVSISVTPRDGSNIRFMEGNAMETLETLRRFGETPPAIAVRPGRPFPPASPVPPMLESFMWRSGNRLGITTGELSPQLGEYFGAKAGVLVTAVEDGSAASKAGVKAGDIVTSINGENVETSSDLRRALNRIESGQEFTLGVVRDKKGMTLKGKASEPGERRRTSRAIL